VLERETYIPHYHQNTSSTSHLITKLCALPFIAGVEKKRHRAHEANNWCRYVIDGAKPRVSSRRVQGQVRADPFPHAPLPAAACSMTLAAASVQCSLPGLPCLPCCSKSSVYTAPSLLPLGLRFSPAVASPLEEQNQTM